MKPKKHLTPHVTEADTPTAKADLQPGEATAAKFKLVTKEEHEARRSKAYKYITLNDILNGRV